MPLPRHAYLDIPSAIFYNKYVFCWIGVVLSVLTVLNRSHDPFYNQAFEEYVFQAFPSDDVFLLWVNDPAVVVGSHQNICREVHVETLRRLGIPVVRRITGGGTVYHDRGNVNYTYITQSDGLDYDQCLGPVIAALNRMGIPAEKSKTCDLAIGGRKISGSAQRIAGGRVLHHGTLLFQSDLAMLDRITTQQKNDCFQTKGTLSAICTVTNISEHLPAPMTMEEFQARLLDEMLPSGAPRLTLSAAQEAEVCRLRDEKYHSWEWTWGTTPTFTYEKHGLFGGAPITVSYRARKGIVSDAQILSPILDVSAAQALLNGARLDPDGFGAICRVLAPERPDELMDWLM